MHRSMGMRAAARFVYRTMSTAVKQPSPYRHLKSPLHSVRVLELAGLAPAPFAGMVLSDFGADVIRIDRPGGSGPPDLLCRGKRSCAIDIKKPEGAQLLLKMIQNCPCQSVVCCRESKCGALLLHCCRCFQRAKLCFCRFQQRHFSCTEHHPCH